ncbi:hypothetical protein HCG49_18170 [Arenibacter sp. 6A1]|uniref:hypothetical protein n=1 Tax=Arenibacter sp. 6A1 TaxID=2720391 RepID=UPI0014457F53|nr:hypothetical protein [Arenibacter sp. 6A1]NKI28481.1 hypothetical protein [Arenibacter sp. 6A1]
MNKIKLYKNILVGLTIIIVLLIFLFTIDVISETEDWSFLNIDFENKNNIVSAYGTLIGGILAFLSILFVFFGLLEQRQQILEEKHLREQEEQQELRDKLKLLSSYFKSTKDTIISQGDTLKEYYQKEQESPSEMNTMYFTANKNFTRIIDMDPLSIYKAIRTNFSSDEKWEKTFLNIYSIFDFYSDGLKELQTKYESHIDFKVKEQRKIAHRANNFLSICSEMVDYYKIEFPETYMEYDWVKLANNFTTQYFAYLEECKLNNEGTNFRIVSDNLLLPFLKTATKLRDYPGYEKPICRQLVVESAAIRKNISEIEFHCIHYADDIEKQYNEYFKDDNKHLNELTRIKQQIDDKIVG